MNVYIFDWRIFFIFKYILQTNTIASKDSSNRPNTASSKKETAKTESFYINNSTSKGTVYKSFPNSKSVRKAIPIVAISEKEENLTTKDVHTAFK